MGKKTKIQTERSRSRRQEPKKCHYWKIVQVKGIVINKIDNVMNGAMNE